MEMNGKKLKEVFYELLGELSLKEISSNMRLMASTKKVAMLLTF